MKKPTVLGVILRLPEELVEELQEECGEFNIRIDYFLSYIVTCVWLRKDVGCDKNSFYEWIDWKKLKKHLELEEK